MNHHTGIHSSIIYIAAALFLCCCALPASAQNVNVTATVDSTSIAIGNWIHLALEVKHPASVPVQWQALRDSLGPFDIVRLDTLRPEEANGVVTEKRALIVSRYEPGTSAIPPVVVAYQTAGDTTHHTAQSNAIPIEVRSVAVDTALAIKDLKAPLSVPLSWEEISLYAGIVLLIAALAYGAYMWWKRKQRQVEGYVEELPVIPPDILALEQLRELDAKHVWQGGEVKLFYSEATEIVRRYLEGRYGVAALEMTSDEVLDQLRVFTLPKGMMDSVREFLTGADLVKFAKFMPTATDNAQVIPVATAIVQKTKPEHLPPPVAVAQSAAPGTDHGAADAATQNPANEKIQGGGKPTLPGSSPATTTPGTAAPKHPTGGDHV